MLRQLYGGAITIELPENFEDVSKFRQVPDNQEAFVSKNSDLSLIVEILETPDDSDIEYHWQDLCETNGCIKSELVSKSNLSNCNFSKLHQEWFLSGSQTVLKYGKADQEANIRILLYLIRFPEIKTDILISSNEPVTSESLEMTEQQLLEIVSKFKILNWDLFEQ